MIVSATVALVSPSDAELLLHATRSALRRLKARQLLQREAGRIAQLFVRRLRAMCLFVLTTCGLDQSEPSDRPVGQCDRPGQLPTSSCIALRTQNEAYAQKRVFSPGVVTSRGNEQAGHALLDEFLMLHPPAAEEATGRV